MPTGGVKPEENKLKAWFDAGVHCVGMGSQLMVKNEDGSFNYPAIEESCSKAFRIIEKLIS